MKTLTITAAALLSATLFAASAVAEGGSPLAARSVGDLPAEAFEEALESDDFKPRQARTIAFGAHEGVAYYTVEADGYRVVATLPMGVAGSPTRVVATLANGQKIILSVPQGADEVAAEVEIARQGDSLSIINLSKRVTLLKHTD